MRPLALSRHADLKSRAEGEILVLPERAIRLGGSSAEILRLVEEGGTAESIVATMRDRYVDSPASETETEVRRFLDEMFGLGGIVCPGEDAEVTA